MKQIKATARICISFAVLVFALPLTQHANAQSQWTPELSLQVKRLSDLSFSPDNKSLLYGINSVDLDGDIYLTEFVVSDLSGKNIRTLLAPSAHISSAQWSADGKTVAYLSSESGVNNIWMIDAGGGKGRRITDVKNDISSFQWAPDSQSIAFVMTDPDFNAPDVQDPEIFNKNRLWQLKLDDARTGGQIINLTKDQDFTVSDWAGSWAYDWSADSRKIVFAYQDDPGLDAWTKAQLAVVETDTGSLTKIATENDRWKYFPKFSPDGKWIVFINAPGAFKWSFLWDMKLVPADGGSMISLASSNRRLPFPWQWASDSKSIYYVENDRATYSFFSMPVDGGAPERVFGSPSDLDVPGLNTYLVSSFVDVSSDNEKVAIIGQTYNKPPEIYVSDLKPFSPEKASDANAAFYDVPIGKTQLIEWHSLDNTKVEGIFTYPQNFVDGQRYPLVVQLHGGPNGADFNEYLPLMKFFSTAAYSAKDYFVLRINYRGSLGYGKKFREDLIGKFGVVDIQDIMSGVAHTINLGLVDPEQLFVIGQSNGGTLTSWIITQTDMFKAACPIAGETDYISLEGTNGYFQTSWYLGGSFTDNLQRFLERSPIFHVKNVRTPTLVQGGLLDDNVPHTQLQEFYRALKRVGVDAHLVGYPGSDHDEYPPKLYLRLLQSCLEWTDRHRASAGK
ncbi:S9 family peptidase [Hoeflea prorocentri]|uniref:S9 family peptidase n=1 Tax=Hoeflea prorocentri TaxID=1922333 RepID=A0A9X3ZHU5_9HYPH|nr:S9 family peptidase [Hoeflea prorocentri]MCY6381105.1 S9 family peptidase [Hoeflea prorocentri]MDA5398905.1 S9 family peptidase [Hoeflea prorocentri]